MTDALAAARANYERLAHQLTWCSDPQARSLLAYLARRALEVVERMEQHRRLV